LCYLKYLQDKIVEEVIRVKSESADGTIDFQTTQKMHYLDCCIREVMRLYPVAPLIARDLHSEVQIGECERLHALARLHVAREITRKPAPLPQQTIAT
jgi:cytochrome P450